MRTNDPAARTGLAESDLAATNPAGSHLSEGDRAEGDRAEGDRAEGDRAEGDRAGSHLSEATLAPDWLTQFRAWLDEAIRAGVAEPHAMVVATADAAGRPSARTTLLKHVDSTGFVFCTNYTSRKAMEITANPYASLVFGWYALHRQVVVCGGVQRVDPAESAAYFAARPRDAQLGAWASPQSQVIADRAALEQLVAQAGSRFPPGEPVPVPAHWGGLRVVPDTVEFWQGRAGRLHDRLRFRRTNGAWVVERLAP